MNWIAILGLVLNTIGSVLLAISLNRTLKMLDSSINALEIFNDTLVSKRDIVSIVGKRGAGPDGGCNVTSAQQKGKKDLFQNQKKW